MSDPADDDSPAASTAAPSSPGRPGKTVEAAWQWVLPAPPEAAWAVVADTARFNEAAGFPRYTIEETAQPDGSVRRVGRARILGFLPLAWEEEPFEFVANRVFANRRLLFSGPLASFGPVVAFAPEGEGGSSTRVTYRMRVEPRNLLGRLVAPLFLRKTHATVDRLMREAAAFLEGNRPVPYETKPPELATGAKPRVEALVARLDADGHRLAPRLGAHLLRAPDGDLERIRPRALAASWGAPAREVIELCLAAVRAGLLTLRWDLLCPRCRGAKLSAPSLDKVPRGAHCPSCNIEYGREFSRNVEVTFRPPAVIRAVEDGGFCLMSPRATPHVLVQQSVPPGERRTVAAALPPGPYRLRTLEAGGAADVDLGEGERFPRIVVDGADVAAEPPGAAVAPGAVEIENRGAVRRTIVVESRRWAQDALTAQEVTTLQAFRDLFADETLAPGDDVEIDQITLMFTDLKGSTAMYARMGDAAAYAIVREHYAFLMRAIRANDGAIVKTIGDAVMAAFREPALAVRAALAVQHDAAAYNETAGEDGGPLVVKLGLHTGPCIAVTLNDRLDYFGSTVNLAARLEGQSRGGDIVLSEQVRDDPAVRALLAGTPSPLLAEAAEMKGFAGEIRYWRLPARAEAMQAAAAAGRSRAPGESVPNETPRRALREG